MPTSLLKRLPCKLIYARIRPVVANHVNSQNQFMPFLAIVKAGIGEL